MEGLRFRAFLLDAATYEPLSSGGEAKDYSALATAQG